MHPPRGDRLLGATCVLAALVLVFVVIPLDTESGLVEAVRRRMRIGDALAPTVAAGFILAGGVLLLFSRPGAERNGAPFLPFLAALLGIVVVSLVAMRHAGPLAVEMAGAGEYRLLRDTAPWKHVGFVLGGTALVGGLIAILEGRASLRALLVGLGMAFLLIALFDLPFGDLLLPPNGDV